MGPVCALVRLTRALHVRTTRSGRLRLSRQLRTPRYGRPASRLDELSDRSRDDKGKGRLPAGQLQEVQPRRERVAADAVHAGHSRAEEAVGGPVALTLSERQEVLVVEAITILSSHYEC